VTLALVFLGAIVGAPARYLTDRFIGARHDSPFPWGTFVVNLTGCLILGALTGTAPPGPVMALVGTGFCGALTTYSTFGFETIRLLEQRNYFYAVVNVTVSVIAGLGAALLGYTVAHALIS
jgi:CrcB protein